MQKIMFKVVCLSLLLNVVSMTDAKDWFGKNNRWGGGNSFFGNSNGCNDWPEWTPMYWMEEMIGNNNCYSGAYGGRYGNPYQSAYSPYAANPYLANPYMAQSPYGYGRPPAYGALTRSNGLGFSPFGSRGMSSFPAFSGSGLSSPFSGFSGASSPFSSFGGGSPWSSFGSPMSSPMGLGSLGGFGSPFSPMSPMSMGTMGVPGMSPFGGMGSSMPFGGGGMPFGGGSGFSPFR